MAASDPLQVGVTGGIGAGKSLVCRLLALMGAPVYDADQRARHLMSHHPPLRRQVQEAFGARAYDAAGALDRAYLAERVFADSAQVARLNALVHPCVAADYATWVAAHPHATYVVKEAALLYESGAYAALDQVVVVWAPAALRTQRVVRRDPARSPEQIRAIMDRQWPDEEKMRRAAHVVRNDDRTLVVPQVVALHAAFQERASRQ